MRDYRNTICASLLLFASFVTATAQRERLTPANPAVPSNILRSIIRAEDERRWDDTFRFMLGARNVRERAALAMGRIGDERAVPVLVDLLKTETDSGVLQMIVFAIGEIESPAGAEALIAILDDTRQPAEVRARAVEGLGKIGVVLLSNTTASTNQGALPKPEDKPLAKIRTAILDSLKFEAGRASMPNRSAILLGLTAALRTRPEGAGPVIIRFLNHSDPRIVADALNTMARLRLKDGNEQVRNLLGNGDVIVRANAARVIGAAEDKGAFDPLLGRALNDSDLRVRVSAIRALGALKDRRAVEPLVKRGNSFFQSAALAQASRNELLEITTTLGRLLPNTRNEDVVAFLRQMHNLTKGEAVEVETAFARIAPGIFQAKPYQAGITRRDVSWRQVSARAQGLAAIRDVIIGAATGSAEDRALKEAQKELSGMLNSSGTPSSAIADVLQAYASYKPADTDEVAGKRLRDSDVIIRAAAAEVLGGQPPGEANAGALINALKVELQRTETGEMNDATLSILDALAKQKSASANEAIKMALASSDHLIRRKAVMLLKANGGGDFSHRIGSVKTRNTEADYRRAIARIGKQTTATVVTSKGSFTIEFLPEAAPLTVNNFVELAHKGYFNGQTIPRVVPNFVIQAGDPRGDGNGGPGYQIRCEINEVPYERAAVGMALSGKDTGGSQWFVTHSPQPHLDGGYTVFGRVISGMEVVDNISRGDTIRRVTVNEH